MFPLGTEVESPELVPIVLGIAEGVRASWIGSIKDEFDSYLQQHDTDRWQIFSDYVLRAPKRPNDVFAFTVFPAGRYLQSLLPAVEQSAKADFKAIRSVSDGMIQLLKDRRLFTVCFVLEPNRTLLLNLNLARLCLDRTISVLSAKETTPRRVLLLEKLRSVRQEARSNSFNVRLFENILLAAGFSAFLSSEICVNKHPKMIGWFSDRDSIVEAYKDFANYLYIQNLSDLVAPQVGEWKGPDVVGVNGRPTPGSVPWSDSFTRIPDHFAGAIAAMDIRQEQPLPDSPKYGQVLRRAVAGNTNIKIIRIFPHVRDDSYVFNSDLVSIGPSFADDDQQGRNRE